MSTKLLILFLFVLCIEARSSSDLPIRSTSEQRALNSTKSSIQKQNVDERTEKLSILKDRKVEEKHEGFYETSKAQRGKGASGGSNVNHKGPRPQSSSPLMSSWTSTLALHGSLALTFLFSLHFF
ncbi:hypothetical protein QN277_024419 [Acacia crassicarpa]|uniref:Uncharacterized protein n=1 Tax=Acacia crassicarpa TaxID=499986 RepID=A0AAE1MHB2_9FABA|nr:hypothetical protein QN277_024419 [Acacia crassicarpa]